MKKIIFLLFIFCLPITKCLAQTITPTTTPTSSDNVQGVQEIRNQVQKVVEKKLNEITDSTDSQNQKKGIVGQITSIKDNKITLSQTNTQEKTILTDENTAFIDTKRNKTTIDKLKEGQAILVLGYDINSILSAKRIIFVKDTDTQPTTKIVTGLITDISKTSSIIAVTSLKNKDLQYQLKVSDTTILKKYSKGQKIAAIIKIIPNVKTTNTFSTTKIISLENPQPTPTPSSSKPKPSSP